MFTIRPYHPADLTALYHICLHTGDNGEDASHLFSDPAHADLFGHFYAAPYAVLEPDLCFILTADHQPCGYILGTRDSTQFYDRCETDWFPVLRERYPLEGLHPDDQSAASRLIRNMHEGHPPPPEPNMTAYPAHLHIDILPSGQGNGFGRALIERFIGRLLELNVPGLHLSVSKSNKNAVGFYQRMGFHLIHDYPQAMMFGMTLNS